MSASDSTRPFLNMPLPCLTEWARMAPSASATGSSPNFISLSEAQRPRHLRHDRHGDFGRPLGADAEPDGTVNARDICFRKTSLVQTLAAREAWVFFEPRAPM